MLKRFLVIAVMCLLIGYSSSQNATYQMASCVQTDAFGRYELTSFKERPNWAISWCTGAAEKEEEHFAKQVKKLLFIQSYEALLDMYGRDKILSDIEFFMNRAGYKKAISQTLQTETRLTYKNTSKRTGYIVRLFPKKIDYYLMFIKYKI